MGLFNLFKPSKTVVVMDGVSLNDAVGPKGGNVAPRNQLQLLRRLSRFAEREKIEVVVVLSGSPLHKAPAGEKFEDVVVVYSKSTEAHAKYIVKVASSKGSGAILVSGNVAVEKMALASGTKTMRLSTFRKAFDTGGNGAEGGGERSERGGNARAGRNRPPRRRQQKQQPTDQQRSKPERPPKRKPESAEADAINELIDLVD